MRLATVGLTLAVGAFCLLTVLGTRGRSPSTESHEHFDDIADAYEHQLPAHIRDLLVTRKTDLLASHLTQAGVSNATGLDVGCGYGAHIAALGARGHRVVGMEPAVRSAVLARRAGLTVAAGVAEAVPFEDGGFDFAYAVGALHHVTPGARRQAFDELRRVLRPGGCLLIHETNPRNPLFRFYMGYLFPIVRRIDEGTEEWLDPREIDPPGFVRIATDYVTFLPDFLPRSWLPWSLRVEARLERSWLRPYAAHYLVVLRRN